MAIDESTGGDGIVARKSIQSLADLRGKRVAVQSGLPSEFFFRVVMKKAGVPLSDVETIDMQTDQAGAAFLSGRVDAAVVWEPWLSRAETEGDGHILASTAKYPDLIVDCLAFNPAVIERSPGDVQKIVDALLRAIDFWKADPQEADKIMAPHFQVSTELYEKILAGAKFCDLERNREYFGTSDKQSGVFDVARTASDIWLEAGAIKHSVEPKSIISTKFVSGRDQ
jgi:NitT/TauT family transport system substrate-binding protein